MGKGRRVRAGDRRLGKSRKFTKTVTCYGCKTTEQITAYPRRGHDYGQRLNVWMDDARLNGWDFDEQRRAFCSVCGNPPRFRWGSVYFLNRGGREYPRARTPDFFQPLDYWEGIPSGNYRG
jgi:hypothetical protein